MKWIYLLHIFWHIYISYFFFPIYITRVYVKYPYNLISISVADRNIVVKIYLLSLFVNLSYT